MLCNQQSKSQNLKSIGIIRSQHGNINCLPLPRQLSWLYGCCQFSSKCPYSLNALAVPVTDQPTFTCRAPVNPITWWSWFYFPPSLKIHADLVHSLAKIQTDGYPSGGWRKLIPAKSNEMPHRGQWKALSDLIWVRERERKRKLGKKERWTANREGKWVRHREIDRKR